jgi:hypothetical protein
MSVPAPPKTKAKSHSLPRASISSTDAPILVLSETKPKSYSPPHAPRNQVASKRLGTSEHPQKRRIEDISAILESKEAKKKAMSREKAVGLGVGEGEDVQPKVLWKTKVRAVGGWTAFAAVEK